MARRRSRPSPGGGGIAPIRFATRLAGSFSCWRSLFRFGGSRQSSSLATASAATAWFTASAGADAAAAAAVGFRFLPGHGARADLSFSRCRHPQTIAPCQSIAAEEASTSAAAGRSDDERHASAVSRVTHVRSTSLTVLAGHLWRHSQSTSAAASADGSTNSSRAEISGHDLHPRYS